MEYPKFYRLLGQCLRQDSPTEAWIITLPPQSKVPLRQHVKDANPEHIDLLKKGMTATTAEDFKSFVFGFYQSVAQERARVNGVNLTTTVIP